MSAFVDLYHALWNATLDRYAKRKDSPGQMSLFGHDVEQEPRDPHGRWTTGGNSAKSPATDGDQPAETPTLTDEQAGDGSAGTEPKAEERKMDKLLKVVLAREPSSEKQRQYMEDVLARASAKLDELEAVAPQSTEVVRKRHQELLSKPKTHFADNIINGYKDKDFLGEVYTVAERELRNKEEKAALMPLRQAAAEAFRAIPPRRREK